MESKETRPSQGISSRYGLKFEQGGDLTESLIWIPTEVTTKVGGRDVITRKIHPEVFNGSWPLGGKQHDDQYVVEFPSDTPIEKIQAFVDTVEKLADQATE
jgi:hypothetical protein